MAKFEIRIQWALSSEHISLDFGQLKEGDFLTTTEVWADKKDPGPHTYEAVCSQVKKSPETDHFEVLLSYKKELNPHLKDKWISWGDFRIVIKKTDDSITGEMPEFKASAASDGSTPNAIAKKVTILFCDLYQEAYESVNRRIRLGQTEMRADLMHLDTCCVISGETTEQALEAAHIVDAKNGGVAHIRNSFLLRADLHNLFDANVLSITTDGTWSIQSKKMSPDYESLIKSNPRLNDATLERISEALKNRLEERQK